MSAGGDIEDQFEEQEYVFYKDRPEWSDVTPIPQDDGDSPIVKIQYQDQFRDVYDYFRGIMKLDEKSERALELTKDAAELNPANYTVWQYRRNVLFALNKDLEDELEYIKQIGIEYPKNYQIWHHRRVIVEKLQDGSKELEFTAALLDQDSKNYHAWQHRQWAIKTFKLYEFELDYVDELLEKDLRNNSAWTQRNFVLQNTTGFTKEVLETEVNYTLSKIENAKDNESAWNYLRGLLLHEENGLINNKVVTDFCENLYKGGNRSPFLLAFIVDICDEYHLQNRQDNWYTIELALQICNDLATEIDPIRKSYWFFVADSLIKKRDGEENPTSTE